MIVNGLDLSGLEAAGNVASTALPGDSGLSPVGCIEQIRKGVMD